MANSSFVFFQAASPQRAKEAKHADKPKLTEVTHNQQNMARCNEFERPLW